MINKQEVMDFSEKLGLEARVIEKDYVLGWLLAGINNHPAIADSWVFKGGTCLKKCYFETYRFSEDLDFTLKSAEHLSMEFLQKVFAEIAEWVYEQSGIEIPADSISFDIHPDPAKKYVEGKIGYVGPFGRTRGNVTKVKLDLSANEILVLEPVLREVHHPYSDRPEGGINANCYAYEEVFAEKIRAMAERLRPRDLYDVIHLYRHQDMLEDRSKISSALEKKCAIKGIAVPTFQSIANHTGKEDLIQSWEHMLKHQLAVLPAFDSFWNELAEFFEWLIAGTVKAQPASLASIGASESVWAPSRVLRPQDLSAHIERIRMAASNRVCIHLLYSNEQRTVEPYSFRTSKDGNLLFYGFHREDSEIKAFTVSKIQRVEVTDIPYTPRYRVEINTSLFSAPSLSQTLPRRAKPFHHGPTYIVQCTSCGKRFSHTTRDTSLRPHKTPGGYDCSGRHGVIMEIK